MSSTMQSLTPHVYWAQRHGDVYLRVELCDAKGHGAKGDNDYEFRLEFLEPVSHKSTQRQVNIKILKKEEDDESDAEKELQAKEEQRINKITVESRIRKDPYLGLKKGYLFMYNLVQFLGFSWIFVNMTVTGRNVILFVIFGSLEQMQNKSVVFFVFYLWSTIEIFRYPFYMLACIDTEWKLLTWLRYTIWIPLYPMGVIAEAVAVIQSMPVFDEMRLYSLPLPAALGQSLSFSYTRRLPGRHVFQLISDHLYKQRKRRFRSRKRKQTSQY
ncbi:hypothetical protein CRUP_036305, partial [Coryphaenoides rupestris]